MSWPDRAAGGPDHLAAGVSMDVPGRCRRKPEPGYGSHALGERGVCAVQPRSSGPPSSVPLSRDAKEHIMAVSFTVGGARGIFGDSFAEEVVGVLDNAFGAEG